jgi:hypothetical protein
MFDAGLAGYRTECSASAGHGTAHHSPCRVGGHPTKIRPNVVGIQTKLFC